MGGRQDIWLSHVDFYLTAQPSQNNSPQFPANETHIHGFSRCSRYNMELEDKTLWKEEQEQASTGVGEALMWTAKTSTNTWCKFVVGFMRHVANSKNCCQMLSNLALSITRSSSWWCRTGRRPSRQVFYGTQETFSILQRAAFWCRIW